MRYMRSRLNFRTERGRNFGLGIIGLVFFLLIGAVWPSCAHSASFYSDEAPNILLVDDGWTPYFTFGASFFQNQLDRMGLEFDIFDASEDATVPTISFMSEYDIVIWTSGDNYGPLTNETARRVAGYLETGGAMFISSVWFAELNDSVLMTDIFRLWYEFDTRPFLMFGRPSDAITSQMSVSLESVFRYRNKEYSCFVSPLDDYAEVILSSRSTSWDTGTAVKVPSDGASLDYRAVITCFPFEAMVDTSGGSAARDEFFYRTMHWLFDTSPPEVSWVYPEPDITVSYSNTAVYLELSDLGAGVNPESVSLFVNGEAVEPETTVCSDCLAVSFRNQDPFPPGSDVTVEVLCSDYYKAPNEMERYRYSFQIDSQADADVEAPYVEDFGPTGDSLRPDDILGVFAVLKDDGTGVDRASLRMTINGADVDARTQRVEGGCAIWHDTSLYFGSERHYDVSIEASDLASPANEMISLQFSYSIGPDSSGPFVSRVSPADGEIVDLDLFWERPHSGLVSAWVKDHDGDVDPSRLRVTINGSLVDWQAIEILNGRRINYSLRRSTFDYGQEVTVTVSAVDEALSPNGMEPFVWSFFFDQNNTPPEVIATIPGDGDSNVASNSHIFAIVSRDIDPDGVSSDTVRVSSDEMGSISSQVFFNPDVPCIDIVANELFASGATISVTIGPGLSDTGGNMMAEAYEFEFGAGGRFDSDPPLSVLPYTEFVGDGRTAVYWRSLDDLDAVFHRVYYDSDGCCEPYDGSDAEQGRSPITVFGANGLLLSGLTNGDTYHISVTAVDGCCNESDYTVEFVVTPTSVIPPPELLTARAGHGSVELEWERSEGLSAVNYRVHYRAVEGDDEGFVDIGDMRRYILKGLSDEISYEVWVSALSSAGEEGEASERRTVRPSIDVDWLELHPGGPWPPGRYDHKFILDPTRKRAYLLGGYAEVEEADVLHTLNLENLRWELVPTSGPFPPAGRTMAFYDGERDTIWQLASDRIVYQLLLPEHRWIAHEPAGEPPPVATRSGSTLPGAGFLDERRNRLLFYGNDFWDPERIRLYEFYSFDLLTFEWTTLECTSEECPSQFIRTSIVFVPSHDCAYMFGGVGEDGISSKIYSLWPQSLSWVRQPSLGMQPQPASMHDMVYDPEGSRLIVVSLLNGELSLISQVYSYHIPTGEWRELSGDLTGVAPEGRILSAHLVVPPGMLGSDSYLLQFGGYGYPEILDDLWLLKLYDYHSDKTPPGRVADLSASVEEGGDDAILRWTAPGDDGAEGKARYYDLRYSNGPIESEAEFDAATPVRSLYFPSFPGVMEQLSVTLPDASQVYYFALKTYDEVGNVSELSNCASTFSAFDPSVMFDYSPFDLTRHSGQSGRCDVSDEDSALAVW
ncbi:Ig-like domain-containing protein [bacterium]|nr:Ig-like domain-containing protein [bacterium]